MKTPEPAVIPTTTAANTESPTTPVLVVKQVAPVYPAMARQMKIAGAVTLNVTVEPDGKVSKVDVLTGNPLLVPGAVSAVKQWQYRPATVRGTAVRSSTSVVLRFDRP